MQFFYVFLVFVAVTLSSAQVTNLPPCSLNCFINALSGDGCMPLTNFACHCAQPNLAKDITPCVEKACDKPAQSVVSSIVVAQCSKAGHPVSIPPVGDTSRAFPVLASYTAIAVETTAPVFGTSKVFETAIGISSQAAATTSAATFMPASVPASQAGFESSSSSHSVTSTSGLFISPVIRSSSAAGPISGLVSVSNSARPSGASIDIPAFRGAAPNVEFSVAGAVSATMAAIMAYVLS